MAKKTIPKESLENEPGQGSPVAGDAGGRHWQDLFVLTEHWKSDLGFFQDELKFFRNLIDRHFLSLIEEDIIERTRRAVTDLAALEKERGALGEKVATHMHELSALAENPSGHGADTCDREHARLEKAFAELTRRFRAVKNEIFQVAEKALGSEKQRHLVGKGTPPGTAPEEPRA